MKRNIFAVCDLEVDYALELNGSYVGDCNIQLEVRERTKENLSL